MPKGGATIHTNEQVTTTGQKSPSNCEPDSVYPFQIYDDPADQRGRTGSPFEPPEHP